MLKKILNLTLIIACMTSIRSINAVTIINSPNGQFFVEGGQTACTAIAVTAAEQLLTSPASDWTQERLDTLIASGVANHKTIAECTTQPFNYFFNAFELAPHFPELQLLQVINIAPIVPTDPNFAIFLTAQEQVTTIDDLPEVMLSSSAQEPVAGVWTANNTSQLICYQNNRWLFLDSHTQSNGTPGASVYLFDSSFEFRMFLTQHHVFQLHPNQEATVTLLKRASPILDIQPKSAVQEPYDSSLDLFSQEGTKRMLPTPIDELFPTFQENIDYTLDANTHLTSESPPKKRARITQKSYRCTYEGCTFATAYANHLTRHMMLHAKQKPFKCTYQDCHFSSTTNSALNIHMRIHTGQRPYKCPYPDCHYAAKRRSDITAHEHKRHRTTIAK